MVSPGCNLQQAVGFQDAIFSDWDKHLAAVLGWISRIRACPRC